MIVTVTLNAAVDRTLGSVQVYGVSPEYQQVQDYRFQFGDPLTEVDMRERRLVAVVGADITDKLFDGRSPVGQQIHVHGLPVTIIGTIIPKGRVLGQSFDRVPFVKDPAKSARMNGGLRTARGTPLGGTAA